MAVTRVQSTKAGSGSASVLILTLPSTPIQGNTIALWGSLQTPNTPNPAITSVVQTGVTWTRRVTVNGGVGYPDGDIWTGYVGSGASTTVTVTFPETQPCVALAAEYSGVKEVSVLDNSGTAAGFSQTATVSSTSAFVNELWFGGLMGTGSPTRTWGAPTNSFSIVDQQAAVGTSTVNGAIIERLVTSVGAVSVSSTTISTSTYWIAALVLLRGYSTAVGTVRNRQDGSNVASAASGVTVTMPATPSTGNTLVATITIVDSGGTAQRTVTGITQTGATWSRAVTSEFRSPGAATYRVRTEIWYAPNVTSAGTSVAISVSGLSNITATVVEYTGILQNVECIDVSNKNRAQSTTPSLTPWNTTTSDQVCVLAIGSTGLITHTYAASNYFALTAAGLQATNITMRGYERNVNALVDPNFTNITLSTSQYWAAAMATFSVVALPTFRRRQIACGNNEVAGTGNFSIELDRPLSVDKSLLVCLVSGITTNLIADAITQSGASWVKAATSSSAYPSQPLGCELWYAPAVPSGSNQTLSIQETTKAVSSSAVVVEYVGARTEPLLGMVDQTKVADGMSTPVPFATGAGVLTQRNRAAVICAGVIYGGTNKFTAGGTIGDRTIHNEPSKTMDASNAAVTTGFIDSVLSSRLTPSITASLLFTNTYWGAAMAVLYAEPTYERVIVGQTTPSACTAALIGAIKRLRKVVGQLSGVSVLSTSVKRLRKVVGQLIGTGALSAFALRLYWISGTITTVSQVLPAIAKLVSAITSSTFIRVGRLGQRGRPVDLHSAAFKAAGDLALQVTSISDLDLVGTPAADFDLSGPANPLSDPVKLGFKPGDVLHLLDSTPAGGPNSHRYLTLGNPTDYEVEERLIVEDMALYIYAFEVIRRSA